MAPVKLAADDVLPLLRVRVGDLPKRALVVGDPQRAARVAKRLTAAEKLGENREYHVYRGKWNGEEVLVASHGVGSAGAAVCFEELARAGVTTIIRSGTAGGMQPEVRDGALVVATGAVREDGVSHQLVPTGFPALATPSVALALNWRAAARVAGGEATSSHMGVVLTQDCFYPSDVPMPGGLASWQPAGVVAVEMEAAALFVIAALHGINAGAIFAIDGNPLLASDTAMADYDPYREVVTRAVDAALTVALDALVG